MYIPDVNYKNKKINSLYFKVDKVKYSIQHSINEDDTDHSILENEHKIYNDANEEFYKWIINNKLISKMSEQVKLIENEYRNGPLSGYFDPFSHCVTYNAVDRNKSYTSLLLEMKYFPVFNEFDNYQIYDDHKLEDYTKYFIQASSNIESSILFDAEYSINYGYILKKLDYNMFKILYYRRPSNLIESNSLGIIQNLWNTPLSNELQRDKENKKYIANVTIGKLEKRNRKTILSKIFLDKQEAYYYRKIYGGNVYTINDIEFIPDVFNEKLDNYIEYSDKKIYILQLSNEVILDEGFTPIKDFIYNLQRYYLYDVYSTMMKNHLKPIGVKTDSVIVEATEKRLDDIFHFNKEIGGYKFEDNKYPCDKQISLRHNTLMNFNIVQPYTYTIESEKDFNINNNESIEKYNNEIKSILKKT